ncbi:MAG: sigma 54-interacting transcriptional regulator [Myxococcota bacterium]|nr:sigma 54-interacting transcriptional regulator [Myxococcota bacterium]
MAPRTRAGGSTTAPSGGSTLGEAGEGELTLAFSFPRTDGPTLSFAEIGAREALLGRDDDCTVPLPGAEVSRRHAAIQKQGRAVLLRDLDSRNGSFVNGRRVTAVVLDEGDVVRIGGWVGVVTRQPGALGMLAPGLYAGPHLRHRLSEAERAASSDLPILIEGETGTGKEAAALAIHGWSRRRGPFVAVNCAAFPESLAEAELFGYRRGAFTGAERPSLGHFRAAQHGTLLLDEIGDLPLSLQAKLLRVIEQREVLPLGESSPVALDVRLLAAAQEPLSRAVSQGRFRADLFARLDGLTVRLPPLRERPAEIPYLFAQLLLDHSGSRPPEVDARLVERLCLYDWPFNVRELVLLVKRLLVLHGGEPALKVGHLPERMRENAAKESPEPAVQAVQDPPELSALAAALRASGGNVAQAAAALGISRQRAYRMMQGRSEIDLDSLREQEQPE